MKKRLRKKHHVGEFTEWGHQLIIIRNWPDGFEPAEGLTKRPLRPMVVSAVEPERRTSWMWWWKSVARRMIHRQTPQSHGLARCQTADVRTETGPLFDLWSDSWEEIEMKMEFSADS